MVFIISLFIKLPNQFFRKLSLWVIFHNIYHTYHEIKILDKFGSTKKSTSNQPQGTLTTESPLGGLTTATSDLHDVQLWPYQVWNWGEFGFDPNRRWQIFFCMYNWCNVSRIWPSQNGENAPFWWSLLIFSRIHGQWFLPPVVIHQSENTTKELFMVFPDTGQHMQLLLVIWTMLTGWRTSGISVPYLGQWHGTDNLPSSISMTPTTMTINLMSWWINPYITSWWRQEIANTTIPITISQNLPLKSMHTVEAVYVKKLFTEHFLRLSSFPD